MKKIFAIVLSAAALLIGTQANAQISVGAGWLNSTEKETYTNSSTLNKVNLNGFYVGGQFNIPIVAGLSVAPGLYLDMLFGKDKGGVSGAGISVSGDANYSELALNVPVNFAYAVEVGDFKVFAYLGPNFQLGLMSKTVGTLSISSVIPGASGSLSGKVTTDNYTGKISGEGGSISSDPSRAPFNLYIGGGAGIQAGNFQVIIGYDHSLFNISKVDNTKLRRSQIKIGVGYAF